MESDHKHETNDVKSTRPRGRPKGSTKTLKDPGDQDKNVPLAHG